MVRTAASQPELTGRVASIRQRHADADGELRGPALVDALCRLIAPFDDPQLRRLVELLRRQVDTTTT